MKSHLIAVLGLTALLAGPAMAADAARPAPMLTKAPMAAPYSWTGFYVGANVGVGWGDFDPSTTTVFSPTGYFAISSVQAIATVTAIGQPGPPTRLKSKEPIGGAEAGYNWQSGMVVYGLEADIEYFHLKSSITGFSTYPCCAPTSFTINTDAHTDWLFTARPRLGLAINNDMIYVTGGVAVTNLNATFQFTDTFANATESAAISQTGGLGGRRRL